MKHNATLMINVVSHGGLAQMSLNIICIWWPDCCYTFYGALYEMQEISSWLCKGDCSRSQKNQLNGKETF